MIVQFDVNTIWRRKFGQALQRLRPDTMLFAPHAWGDTPDGGRRKGIIPVSLPPGWASKTAAFSMPILEWRAQSAARPGGTIDTAIFTSFQYLPLARRLRDKVRIAYYCSDDYRGYAGWSGADAIEREAELCRIASLAIFVSDTLRDRAVAEYGLDPSRCIVAPNASEPRFSTASPTPPELAALDGPVFGVVGVFNERIDYPFLEAVAAHPDVPTLALIGPIAPTADAEAVQRLRDNPNVFLFGARPHDEIHHWMAGIDVAVIPYAPNAFNHHCSPMRLWDHLAIGQPILATSACDQVARHPNVCVTESAPLALDASISRVLRMAADGRRPHLENWDDRAALVMTRLDLDVRDR